MDKRAYRTLRAKGYRASEAYRMAKAYSDGNDWGLSLIGDYDSDADMSWCECEGDSERCVTCHSRRGTGAECVRADGHEYHDHDVYWVRVEDGQGNVLASLGGIVDAGNVYDFNSYAFDVKCELLAEAISELRHSIAQAI